MKNKKNLQDKRIRLLSIICIVVMALCFILLWDKWNDQRSYYVGAKEESLDSNCDNLNIFETSYCLKLELDEWYNFNMSNTNEYLTEDELKEQGGVCSQYSGWYASKLKERGFLVKETAFAINKSTGHRVTIVANELGYCVLDQLKIGCVEFLDGGQV